MLWIAWCVLTACCGFVGAAMYWAFTGRLEEGIARHMLRIFLETPADDIDPKHRAAHAAWPRRDKW